MSERAEETIVVLDDETINKVAAGEVIERPASVVKELVENAIDAGASGVTVELRGAPGEFIRVSDNGSGMSRRDAKMAFLRHATSKIRRAADLATVLTMGFRGEALASIGAVARVELVTRRAGDAAGTRIVYEGGALVLEEDAASPVGTAVTCRDLFFNTPARRKFQRRPATELDHVHEVVARLALAWPKVRFRLIQGGREALLAQGDAEGDRRLAIASVYGAGLAKVLLPVVAGTARTRIEGFISAPDASRPGRDAQCVFVNARPVVAPAVVRVIENAYGRRLPAGRHPAVFLWISTDPTSIDVNVHPAKREVRFSGGHEVFGLAAQAAASALRSVGAAPDLGRKLGSDSFGGNAQAVPGPGPGPRWVTTWQRWPGGAGRGATGVQQDTIPEAVQDGAGTYSVAPHGAAAPVHPGKPEADVRGGGADPADLQAAGFAGAPMHGDITDVTSRVGFVPLGVFLGTYILATDGDDLVIVDQHAAHERVMYEEVLEGLGSGRARVQTLIPTTLEISPRAAARVEAILGELAKLGFLIEPFGPSSLLLRGIPAALAALRGTGDVVEVVQAALEASLDDAEGGGSSGSSGTSDGSDGSGGGIGGVDGGADSAGCPGGSGGRDPGEVLERVAAQVACKAAVKARRALEPAEIERLLADLARAKDPYSCPHGRPTVLRISRAEIERAFRRG